MVKDIKNLSLSKDNQAYSFKLVGIILRNNFIDYKDLFEYTAIPTDYIKKSFNGNNYNQWLKVLIDNNIVLRNGYYGDNTCYNYCINPKYFDETELETIDYKDVVKLYSSDIQYLNQFKNDIEELDIDYSKLQAIITKRINEINIDSFAINDEILDNSFKLKIDKSSMWITKADAITKAKEMGMDLIKDNKQFLIADNSDFITKKKQAIEIMYNEALLNLQNGNYRAKRNSTNERLDTNITNMCSELVDEICNQNELVQIDLRNSQFAILSLMLQDKLKTMDFKLFKELSASGKLYEYIKDKLSLNTRKEAKNACFEILFSSHKNRTKNKAKLKELFPSVIEFIDNYKKENGDNQFAIKMQRRESKMFIDDLYNQLKKRKLFILTKHDSLIIRKENESEIIELVEAYFKALNFEYSLDIKQPKKVAEIKENKIYLMTNEEVIIPSEYNEIFDWIKNNNKFNNLRMNKDLFGVIRLLKKYKEEYEQMIQLYSSLGIAI